MGKDTFVLARVDKKVVPDVLGAIFADKGRPTQVAVSQIRTDGGTQMRAGLDDSTVFEYTQAMIAAGGWGEFPAVVAYHDGAAYWLADGFHRVQAYRDAFPDASKTIPVEVRAGTRRDAILHAAGANASHGLRRSNADKWRAVDTLLRDAEWTQWSDTEIARRCAVDPKTVGNLRRKLTATMEIPESTTRKGADGRTINTASIGTKPAPAVLNTPTAAPKAPRVDDGYDEVRVTQPIVYTYERMRKIAGDHLARGIAARKPDDEAIEHPLDCYDDNGAPAAGKMRDLWELRALLQDVRDQKAREYAKLTGLEVPAVLAVALSRMIDNLTAAMDAYQAEVETNYVNQ